MQLREMPKPVPLLTANVHLVCIQDRQETVPLQAFTTTISLHERA